MKKINEELEKLDDEQLDQVAGGTLLTVRYNKYTANDQNTPANQLGSLPIRR